MQKNQSATPHTLTQAELVNRVAAVTDTPRRQAHELVYATLAEIKRAAHLGEPISLRGITMSGQVQR